MNYTVEDLITLMRYGDKVEYSGHLYIISAVIIRERMIVAREIKKPPVLQVELMDLRANSVIIVPAEEIKFLI